MLRKRLPRLALPLLLGVVGCNEDSAGPKLPPCTASGFAINDTVGQYLSLDPGPVAGCVVFPVNTGVDSVEYLVVPQLATGEPGITSSFQLLGDTIRLAALSPPAPVPAAPSSDLASLSAAERFHAFLRLGDQSRWRGLNPQGPPLGPGPALAPAVAAGRPTLGSTRQFMVCAKIDCTRFDRVTATVRALRPGGQVAIYVDTTAPAGGLTDTQLDSLAALFDTRFYATDTAAFGRESDVDTNTVVLVLMTPVLNRLVTRDECFSSGFVAGFFLGADIDPLFRNDSRSNKGEVFYAVVADPSGTLRGPDGKPTCAHSASAVTDLLPVTFIHEFQHMISYGQHVLARGGDGEALWLNEGLSHYAEELGGRTYAVGSPDFSRFVSGDVSNAYGYLDSPESQTLLPAAVTGRIPTLIERGAAWLFVRYLVDRYSGGTTVVDWNRVTRQLLETDKTGAANIESVTGDLFSRIVARWALANWVSDLPGFTADSALQYASWSFRATFASLHAQNPNKFPKVYPLTPTSSSGRGVALSGILHAGSGVYHRVLQAPGAAGFTLLFSTAGFTPLFDTEGGRPIPPSAVPRLSIIRIR
jgi:hypothetical protein